MVALAIMKPLTYLKNTLHEFFGPLSSGLWPDNALNFDILAIIWRLKVHFELKLPIYLVFIVALVIMNPFTYLRNLT